MNRREKTDWSALVSVASMPAQWLNYPSKAIPRLADGKNLTAPDGKPDLSGIRQTPAPKYLANVAADLRPGEVPLQSWAAKVLQERSQLLRASEESNAHSSARRSRCHGGGVKPENLKLPRNFWG
jgi:hypothetical protein